MAGILVNETRTAAGSLVTVEVDGNAHVDMARELRSVLVEVILRRRPARIVIDLHAVASLDSAAIGTLNAAYDAACDVDLVLVIHGLAPALADQLRLAGMPTSSCAGSDKVRVRTA